METLAPKTKRTQDGMSYRAKLLTSISIWFCAFSMGICVNLLSPSLLELCNKYNSDIQSISVIFSIYTFSTLCAALIGAILYNYVNRQLISSILIIGLGVATALIPHAPSLTILFFIGSILGICNGGFNTAQIVWIIEMWEDEASVYIQIQHFSYALGSVISPLLVKPFLTVEYMLGSLSSVDTSFSTTESIIKYSMNNSFPETSISRNVYFYVPFTIAGIFAITGGIGIQLMYYLNRYQVPARSQESLEIPEIRRKIWAFDIRKILLVLLSATFVGAYQGLEVCTNQFFPTFLHYIKLGLSKQNSALIQSGLSGGFTIGRGIGILLALCVFPEYILIGNFVLIIVGNSLLWCFANTSLEAVWIGSITLGLGYSTVFASFYGYIQNHLEITNIMGAVMSVAGGVVASAYPFVIGQAIESNPFVLMRTNFISISLITGSFLILYGAITVRDKRGINRSNMDDAKNGFTNSAYEHEK